MLRFLPLLALQSAFYTYTQSNQVIDQAHAEFEQSFELALFFVHLNIVNFNHASNLILLPEPGVGTKETWIFKKLSFPTRNSICRNASKKCIDSISPAVPPNSIMQT